MARRHGGVRWLNVDVFGVDRSANGVAENENILAAGGMKRWKAVRHEERKARNTDNVKNDMACSILSLISPQEPPQPHLLSSALVARTQCSPAAAMPMRFFTNLT